MQLFDSRADLDPFSQSSLRPQRLCCCSTTTGRSRHFASSATRPFLIRGCGRVLKQIAALANSRLVIVSGRPANEIHPLLGLGHRLEI